MRNEACSVGFRSLVSPHWKERDKRIKLSIKIWFDWQISELGSSFFFFFFKLLLNFLTRSQINLYYLVYTITTNSSMFDWSLETQREVPFPPEHHSSSDVTFSCFKPNSLTLSFFSVIWEELQPSAPYLQQRFHSICFVSRTESNAKKLLQQVVWVSRHTSLSMPAWLSWRALKV